MSDSKYDDNQSASERLKAERLAESERRRSQRLDLRNSRLHMESYETDPIEEHTKKEKSISKSEKKKAKEERKQIKESAKREKKANKKMSFLETGPSIDPILRDNLNTNDYLHSDSIEKTPPEIITETISPSVDYIENNSDNPTDANYNDSVSDEVDVSKSSKKKKPKKTKKKKPWTFGRVVKTILLSLLAAIVVALIALVILVVSVISNAQDIDPNNIYSMLSENSVMYDNQDEIMENVMSSELRTNLDYDEIPPQLINAFVAIEDKTFWKHHGFNLVRIAGAIVEGIKTGNEISGTSTLTQQLARNVFLPDSKSVRTMSRKIEEAYYTIILERNLTKEQIAEAYMNTIYLGFNSYGVEAASETYFGKSVGELTLAECTALATIPKNPSKNALIKRYYPDEIDAANPNIISYQDEYVLVYNDSYKERQALVLQFMLEQGYITQAEYDMAYQADLREYLNPPENINSSTTFSSYFTDYAKNETVSILMDTLGISEAEAQTKLYKGGLSIYTTLDRNIQNVVDTAYENSRNFPRAAYFRKDRLGNAINSDGSIMLYNYNNYFNSDGNFVLEEGQYGYDDYGNLYIYKGNKLNFYNTTTSDGITDITINFKPMYLYKNSTLHITSGGTISINSAYKCFDAENNVVVFKEYLDEHPDIFQIHGSSIVIPNDYFTLNTEVVQPQSATVILDQNSGQIKAMVGGRNIEGNRLYNRANSARQPGSSIKPLATYIPAIIKGMTGSTIIPDTPNYYRGKLWPENSYTGYKGDLTLRKAVQISSNVAAVRVANYIGYDNCLKMLKSMGITTLDDERDATPASMGLGGLTNGLKPVESAGAYATIANGGTYYKPTTIAKIVDRNGDVIYKYKREGKKIFDEGSAFIMTDILKSVVSGGTGSRARIYSNNSTIPVAGKTGTTTNNYDAWFCGFTPYYTAIVWVGNDYNIQLSNGSGAAAQLWSTMMRQVHQGLDAKSFEQPTTVVSSGSEYYVKDRDRISGSSGNYYTICAQSGRLALAGCPHKVSARSSIFASKPTKYCNIHPNYVKKSSNNNNGNNDDNTNNDNNQNNSDNNQNNTDNNNNSNNQGNMAQ